MGLIERIKSALGLGTSPQASQPSSPGSGDDVGVTVEHEPDTASEDAVKGTDTASEESGTGATADATTSETADEDADAGDDERDEPTADLEDVKGIGPTYGERLREAGIESVADLADADPESLADRSGIAQSRVENWVERAAQH